MLSPLIWQRHINDEMEEEWFGESYVADDSVWVRLFESWNNRRTLRRLSSVKLSGKRLLEIGVGSGSFLKAAQERGFDVAGCDLSVPICQQVESRHGIQMHCGPLDDLPENEMFDVVVLNHVLEHVEEPLAFLGEIEKRLTPGGIVHIAVPNIECSEAALSGWTSYEPYHLSYFSTATLDRAVSAVGLKVESMRTHESFSGWFLAVLRTVIGVNKKEGAITRPAVMSFNAVIARSQRSNFIEHAYRVAMVLVGGGFGLFAEFRRYWGKAMRRSAWHGRERIRNNEMLADGCV